MSANMSQSLSRTIPCLPGCPAPRYHSDETASGVTVAPGSGLYLRLSHQADGRILVSAAGAELRTVPATDAALAESLWRRPPALLAALGGGLLLAEALMAALLIGAGTGASSSTSGALLLGLGGLLALCAAHLVLSAPRLASLLCLIAVTLAGLAHMPLFVSLLLVYYGDSSRFLPQLPSLGAVLAPLFVWLLVAVPLVVAAVLAWGQAPSPLRRAVRGGRGL